MFLRQITDFSLAQHAYLIGCQRSGEAIIIDPERDIDRYLKVAADNQLRITAVADTHIHADYLSGARELLEHHGVTAYLSAEGGPDWQFEWAKNHPRAHLLRHDETFHIGKIAIRALLTPGHTPEHMSFLITDHGGGADEPIALLSGDFIFVGDVGRPDLLESAAGQSGVMEPSARQLYASLRETRTLPDHLQILPAHGAGSACGKSLGAIPTSVMGYERKFNPALREALTSDEPSFVEHILSGQPEPPVYFERMKRENRSGPALLVNGTLPSPRRITFQEVRTLMGHVTILDMRTEHAAFAQNHLRGSLFAPLKGGRFSVSAGSYVTATSDILLVAEHPQQVEEATRQLIRIGLDQVIAWIPADEILNHPDLLKSYPSISPEEIPPDAKVLDVRGAEEFQTSHLRGAQQIAHTRLAAQLHEISKDRPLHIHCASGMRAAMASSFLSSKGYDVIHVNGSFPPFPSAR